ncbi:hypothetical protein BG006_004591 [Podila minutissima]|uniref:Uncharacterized protein n=1 Tax=Podila minutissima TaxID=64525 RepID=A0A9P5SLK9_9FUNG|nr:hypothetical protein BG006_004591 [Podila minutissima]
MKILSVSLGLAAVACVAAQAEQAAIDPLAPTNAQAVYTYGAETTDDAAEMSPDDFAYAVSELRFRSHFLTRFEESQKAPSKEFAADSLECFTITSAIKLALDAARTAIKPIFADLGPIGTLLDSVFSMTEKAITNLEDLKNLAVSLNFAILSIQTILGAVESVPHIGTIAVPLKDLLDQVEKIVTCLFSGDINNFVQAITCNNIADLYRVAVAEAAKTSPALKLPESASADLRRLAAGSLSVLDLMGKNAIATTNEALLATRPIFAADLLNQFREELLRAEASDIKMYAGRDLSAAVGISNALEACLRVAADPVAAIDDLNEKLDAADADEEGDIDEDNEDEDEDEHEGEAPEQQQHDQVYYALALKRKDKFGGLLSEPEIRRGLLPLAYNPFHPIGAHVNLVPALIPECIPTPDPPVVVPVDQIPTQIPVPPPGGFDCANYKSSAEETFKTILRNLDELKILPIGDFLQGIIQTAAGKIVAFFAKGFFGANLADLYRDAIAHSLAFRPAVPEDALAEIKRLEAGAAAVLEILRSSSIAADSMDLLEMRPIFGAFDLEVYREELLHLTTSDEIKHKNTAFGTLSLDVQHAADYFDSVVHKLDRDLDHLSIGDFLRDIIMGIVHGVAWGVRARLDIGGARTALEALHHETGFGLSSQCSMSAELYCDSITHALKNAPVLRKRVSHEIKQLHDGSASILSALDKSDAASIDGRMAIRPVFAATESAMYCDDLLRVAQTEDVKKYAAVALGAVIEFSNSLEACLRKADH